MAGRIELTFMQVPAGCVHQGTPLAEVDPLVDSHSDLGLPRSYFAKEAPRHEVFVPGFAMLRVPVTRGLYGVYQAEQGVKNPVGDDVDFPIDEIAWHEAVDFCAWLSRRTGVQMRLPTESEWERAARADSTNEYPWGDEFDPERANLAEAGYNKLLPVGSFLNGESPYGLLDLAGNVDEWTADVYRPYDGAPSDVVAVEDWAKDPHITRGGSFTHHRDLARCSRRHSVYEGKHGAGFRVVFDLPNAQAGRSLVIGLPEVRNLPTPSATLER